MRTFYLINAEIPPKRRDFVLLEKVATGYEISVCIVSFKTEMFSLGDEKDLPTALMVAKEHGSRLHITEIYVKGASESERIKWPPATDL